MYIYQIEVSNVCSLQCEYCPHPTQERRKGFMSQETFAKCVRLYKMSQNRYPLFLHNFGEVLLHPKLPELLRHARAEGVECSFYTNGVRPNGQPYDRDVWRNLADCGLKRVAFSAHALSIGQFRSAVRGVVQVTSIWDPKESPRDTWAGQVGQEHGQDGQGETPRVGPCIFERENAFVVLWDGRISSCCIDVEGRRSPLTVDEVLENGGYMFEPISLCDGCGCHVDKPM